MMIRITTNDLKDLECIGSGKFGKVYKKDDKTAYKIYHPTVSDDLTGLEIINPALTMSKMHFKILMNRSKKLKYSEGVNDLIYINGKFGGVCIPYYAGTTLSKLMNKPIKIKIDLSKQLVRNCKELTEHLIFPTDFKLNNIILSNNNIQLIDLDDKRTHVCFIPNPILKHISINTLGETIQTFLKQHNQLILPKDVHNELERYKYFSINSYKKIDNYLKQKEVENDIIFINEYTDINFLSDIMVRDFKIVFVLSNKDEIEKAIKIINRLKEHGITIYDFITKEEMESYDEVESIGKKFVLEINNLKRVNSNKK